LVWAEKWRRPPAGIQDGPKNGSGRKLSRAKSWKNGEGVLIISHPALGKVDMKACRQADPLTPDAGAAAVRGAPPRINQLLEVPRARKNVQGRELGKEFTRKD